jgi:trans-aconitate methyltransferase
MTSTPHTQRWDPNRYQQNAAFVPQLGAPVLELLAPRPGERILDLGCGDGVLTEKLIEAGCEVVGVDASAEQVAAARARGIDARVMSGEALSFEQEFDAVFSNAALHWMKRAGDVAEGVRRALRPGGRFVAEMGGGDCVGTIRRAVHECLRRRGIDPWQHDPWCFPSDDEYRQVLEPAGFSIDSIALILRPTPLPGDVSGWLETFCESFLLAVPEGERPALIDDVREMIRPTLQQEDGTWVADYVRLRFAAHLPG